MDLISAAYGWSDAQILGCTLARLTQVVAVIQRREWAQDLAHRRLETAKLRTLCTFIASTMQLGEGDDNVMLTEAERLSLGTGTEQPATPPSAGGAAPAERPADTVRAGNTAGPTARVNMADLPDAPPAIRAGQRTAHPAGIRPIPAEKLGAMLGGPGA